MEKRILLVEDDPGLAMTLSDLLKAEGYQVTHAADGESGYRWAAQQQPSLVILDLMLPLKSGLDLCRDLRAKGQDVPILMLTAKGTLLDKVIGLKMGADDYLTKPFESMELLARIEALLRRGRIGLQQGSTYRFGNVRVDTRSAEVFLNGQPVHLAAREYQLLVFFLENRGELLSRDRLMDEVWGYDITVSSRTIDVYVAGLRAKLEENPSKPAFIHTVHGRGYRFQAD